MCRGARGPTANAQLGSLFSGYRRQEVENMCSWLLAAPGCSEDARPSQRRKLTATGQHLGFQQQQQVPPAQLSQEQNQQRQQPLPAPQSQPYGATRLPGLPECLTCITDNQQAELAPCAAFATGSVHTAEPRAAGCTEAEEGAVLDWLAAWGRIAAKQGCSAVEQPHPKAGNLSHTSTTTSAAPLRFHGDPFAGRSGSLGSGPVSPFASTSTGLTEVPCAVPVNPSSSDHSMRSICGQPASQAPAQHGPFAAPMPVSAFAAAAAVPCDGLDFYASLDWDVLLPADAFDCDALGSEPEDASLALPPLLPY